MKIVRAKLSVKRGKSDIEVCRGKKAKSGCLDFWYGALLRCTPRVCLPYLDFDLVHCAFHVGELKFNAWYNLFY